MEKIILAIRDWSEVWSLLIPLAFIILPGVKAGWMKPVRWYVYVGLALSIVSTMMFVFHSSMPPYLKNNNLIYNIHSITRVFFFCWLLFQFDFGTKNRTYKIIVWIYAVFVIINFTWLDSVFQFSSSLFIAESIVLLLFCILFFFNSMQDESQTNWLKHPVFLICAGLSIYEAVNFFTFLFFHVLSVKNLAFLKITWTIHNATFVILCIMIALAIHKSKQPVLQENN